MRERRNLAGRAAPLPQVTSSALPGRDDESPVAPVLWGTGWGLFVIFCVTKKEARGACVRMYVVYVYVFRARGSRNGPPLETSTFRRHEASTSSTGATQALFGRKIRPTRITQSRQRQQQEEQTEITTAKAGSPGDTESTAATNGDTPNWPENWSGIPQTSNTIVCTHAISGTRVLLTRTMCSKGILHVRLFDAPLEGADG